MKAFTEPIKGIISQIEQRAQKGITDITGVAPEAHTHLMYALFSDAPRKVVVAPDEKSAQEILSELRMYDRDTLYFPPKDLIFYQSDLNGKLLSDKRQECFKELLFAGRFTMVTTVDALMEKHPDIAGLKGNTVKIDLSSEIDTISLSERLSVTGYIKTDEVTAPGEFAIRGGIIDIFPITSDNPVRIELFGSDVDTIRYFDIVSQRSE